MNGHFFNRLFWGLVLIGIGALFLLNQFGKVTVDIGYIFRTYWPIFLIFFGLKSLLVQRHFGSYWTGHVFWNAFVALVGVMFLGNNLGWFELTWEQFFQYLIPVLLIVFGISMIFRPNRRPKKNELEDWTMPPPPPPLPSFTTDPLDQATKAGEPESTQPKPKVQPKHHGWHGHSNDKGNYWTNGQNRSSFIGDLYIGHDYWELTPMNISTFIGDVVLDLTKAQIPMGETKLHISSFIGDVKVFVPNSFDVEVAVSASSFLGDTKVFDRTESGMMRSVRVDSPNYSEGEKKVHLHVALFIGDVKVMRVG